jgi:hypothetical protein
VVHDPLSHPLAEVIVRVPDDEDFEDRRKGHAPTVDEPRDHQLATPARSRSTTGPKLVARHERAVGRYIEVLTLDHYLDVLKVKPGGLPGATALAQTRARGAFTRSHQV